MVRRKSLHEIHAHLALIKLSDVNIYRRVILIYKYVKGIFFF